MTHVTFPLYLCTQLNKDSDLVTASGALQTLLNVVPETFICRVVEFIVPFLDRVYQVSCSLFADSSQEISRLVDVLLTEVKKT